MTNRDTVPLELLLQKAHARRLTFLQSNAEKGVFLDAYRIFNGAADGIGEGITLDRYNNHLVFIHREESDPEEVGLWIELLKSFQTQTPAQVQKILSFIPEGVILKMLSKQVFKSQTSILWESCSSNSMWIREHDVRLHVSLNQGIATGVYLDHRETRLLMREYVQDADVLNLFAYTCAFSVHAAKAGAKRVTSVDVSKASLERGRMNMRASGVNPDLHRWFPDDVQKWWNKKSIFDVVIVDPPAFGHGRKSFSLEQVLDDFLVGSIRLTRSGGVLMFSAHALFLESSAFENRVFFAAHSLRRRIEILHRLGIPAWDHPVLAQNFSLLDQGNYLQTLVLKIEDE